MRRKKNALIDAAEETIVALERLEDVLRHRLGGVTPKQVAAITAAVQLRAILELAASEGGAMNARRRRILRAKRERHIIQRVLKIVAKESAK